MAVTQKSDRGMAMVEFVIILPLLLLVLFATIEMGISLQRWQAISNAAREGARVGVVYRSPCNAGTVLTEVRTQVVNYAAAGGITLAPADVTVVGHCGGAGTDTTVTVSTTYTFFVLGGLSTTLGADIDLNASSVMRNEG